MHRELKRETARARGGHRARAATALRRLSPALQRVRPHEVSQCDAGLALAPLDAPYPERCPPPAYAPTMRGATDQLGGTFSWGGRPFFVSETLRGQDIGPRKPPTGSGICLLPDLARAD